MGGYFLYEQYDKLKPIIKHKREKDNNSLIYKEFEKMLNKIRFVRHFGKGPNWGKVGKCL